ncbi:DDE_Tnp_IS1595 domain-containing protein [Caerostris extrusa]|uniref:DDE_Tnp_IS1595 domain-containing protein n=1 Tax=Caerostris extrusa TaxID=172846 RepID=A0AAV4RZX4_CAEEX|nr:DDE_Tnp_IS1595 domain-containing protein [Caerostris extrusa]
MFNKLDIASDEYMLSDYPEGMPSLKKQKVTIASKENKKKYLGMKAFQLHNILKENFIKFCQDLKLIATSAMCYCGEPMAFVPRMESSDGYQWYCRQKKLHNSRFSIRAGTWFEKSHISIKEILWICYMWVHEYSLISMSHECEHSTQTVMDWCSSCRDACQIILENKRNPIGGSDKLVEFFSCIYQNEKKKKSKSQKWVMCAIEQFSTNIICLVVPNKESNTLR